MKIGKKNIFRILLLLIIIPIIGLCGFYFWLNLRFKNVIEKDTYDKVVVEMKASADFPEKFYDNYQKVIGIDTTFTAKEYVFNRIISVIIPHIKRKESSSILAVYGYVYETFDIWTVSFALDKDVKPKKCLDNYLSREYFDNNIKGFRNASVDYFGKEIENLTDNEMIELSIRSINPSFYRRHPEKLREKIIEINKTSP